MLIYSKMPAAKPTATEANLALLGRPRSMPWSFTTVRKSGPLTVSFSRTSNMGMCGSRAVSVKIDLRPADREFDTGVEHTGLTWDLLDLNTSRGIDGIIEVHVEVTDDAASLGVRAPAVLRALIEGNDALTGSILSGATGLRWWRVGNTVHAYIHRHRFDPSILLYSYDDREAFGRARTPREVWNRFVWWTRHEYGSATIKSGARGYNQAVRGPHRLDYGTASEDSGPVALGKSHVCLYDTHHARSEDPAYTSVVAGLRLCEPGTPLVMHSRIEDGPYFTLVVMRDLWRARRALREHGIRVVRVGDGLFRNPNASYHLCYALVLVPERKLDDEAERSLTDMFRNYNF